MNDGNLKQKVYEVIKQIPAGKIAYYGQVADAVGTTAQVVGWMLSGMKEEDYDKIPWHRVVAKTGYVATLKLGFKGQRQIQMLEEEGYEIVDDYLDMKKYYFELNAVI